MIVSDCIHFSVYSFSGQSQWILRYFFLGTLFAFLFVIFHAIRVSGNQDYSGMMDQAVDNGRCHRKVLKDISHLEMRILVVKMLERTFCLSRCQLEDEAD